MTQEPLIWAIAFLLIFVGLLYYFTGRVTAGYAPALRRIQAFEALKGFTGRAIEAGRALHLSLGVGSVANETTADSLAGLAVLDYLAEAEGLRTASELNAYFRKKVQTDDLFWLYEWLARKGIIEKVAAPVRLTKKSQVALEEPAYFYDADVSDWEENL